LLERVSAVLQKNEFIVRIGGEEFGILLATADLRAAPRRAEDI